MNSLDFNNIIDWMSLYKEESTKLLVVGGFERLGLPPQYLFGFGGFLKDNVQATFERKFRMFSLCVLIKLSFFALGPAKVQQHQLYRSFEVEEIRSFWLQGQTAILTEPNADFLSIHQELLDQLSIGEVMTFTDNCTDCRDVQNRQITDKTDFEGLDRVIIASYRGEGIVNNPKVKGMFKAYTISERLILLQKENT